MMFFRDPFNHIWIFLALEADFRLVLETII